MNALRIDNDFLKNIATKNFNAGAVIVVTPKRQLLVQNTRRSTPFVQLTLLPNPKILCISIFVA